MIHVHYFLQFPENNLRWPIRVCCCLYSPSCREGSFSETELPLNPILGNRACGVRGSFNTTTDRYTPLGRCRLRQALRSSLKLATKAIKKMSAGKPKNMMASQYVSTVKLM